MKWRSRPRPVSYTNLKTGYELFQIAPEDNASKLLFAGIRFGMAGLVTILFASLKRKRACLPDRRNIAGILVLGLVQTTLQYVFFYLGLANTTGCLLYTSSGAGHKGGRDPGG